MRHEGFPSEATLAAFIRHDLDDATRREVVRHMAACDDCYATWARANRQREAIGPSKRSRKRLAIAAAMAALLVLLFPAVRNRLSAGASGNGSLAAIARELPVRTVAPRLSAALDYRPVQKVTRGAAGAAGTWRLAESAADIKRKADAAPTAENLHALGVAYLLLGHAEHAAQTLEQARPKSDPLILSDLAAAYYARGVKAGIASDMARSLELSDAALALSPRSLPAQFNRALALEALENRPSALDAWQRYLQMDPSSEWVAEAREHVHRLSAPPPSAEWEALHPRLLRLSDTDLAQAGSIAARFPLRTRRTVENEILPRWARARLRRDAEESGRVLTALTVMGSALETRFGDSTLADTARCISASGPQRSESLARAYLKYTEARAAVGADTVKARDLFRSAWKSFRGAKSPSAYAAGMFAASQEYERRDYGEALRLIGELRAERELTRYAPLAGQVLWIEGLVLLASGRPYESLTRYREARDAFQRIGEVESIGAVDSLIAENLEALGDHEQAWTHRLRALRTLLDSADARRQRVAFNEAAEAALQQDQLAAALEFQTSSIQLVSASPDSETAAPYAHLWRAMILGRKGRSAAALDDVGRAHRYAAGIRDAAIRAKTTADVEMAEALLRQAESPAAAIPLFTRVLDYHQGRGYAFRRAQLLLARGRARVQIADDLNARADFSEAIAAVESQREPIPDLLLRSTFFGKAEDAYGELTALLVRAGELDEALRVFDRSCERTLTDEIRRREVPDSMKPGDAPMTPDAGTTLVQIAVLPREVVAWTMRHSGTSVSRHPVPSGQIDELVASYEQAIAADSAAFAADSAAVTALGSRLYDVLIRPLGLSPAHDGTIVFIPDRRLRPVPFASLYDRSQRRYLIEDFTIAMSPSAAVYGQSRARLGRQERGAGVVAIGNTKTAALDLDLPDLPEAQAELREVALAWQGRLLLDEQATAGALLAAAGRGSVVYFAGHALVNEQDRGRSALVMTPEGDSSSALLYADRIARMRLRAPLVVLSACTTSSATTRPAKGAVDVARAFLAAGVPTVVASRWEVADDTTRDLLTGFARQVAASVSPAQALRSSQLEVLRRGDPAQRAVRSWCAFEVIGAV